MAPPKRMAETQTTLWDVDHRRISQPSTDCQAIAVGKWRANGSQPSGASRVGSAKEFMMKQREFRGIWEWLKLDTTCGDFFGDAVPI